MTDKVQLIKKETERRYEYWKEKEFNSHSVESEIRMSECQHLLLIVDSLPEEPVSENLEKEISNYIKDNFFGSKSMGFLSNRTKGELDSVDVTNIAHHFAEWQKQQMMKDAVEGEIGDIMPFIEVGKMNDYINYVKAHGLKIGDKVKILILKTE